MFSPDISNRHVIIAMHVPMYLLLLRIDLARENSMVSIPNDRGS